MDENKKAEESCCKDEKKDCCCSGKKDSCCGCKVAIAVILFLLGGVIGYLKGACHKSKGCGMGMGMRMHPMMPPPSAPAGK